MSYVFDDDDEVWFNYRGTWVHECMMDFVLSFYEETTSQ